MNALKNQEEKQESLKEEEVLFPDTSIQLQHIKGDKSVTQILLQIFNPDIDYSVIFVALFTIVLSVCRSEKCLTLILLIMTNVVFNCFIS